MIAIIALLAAMLLPSLSRAKEKGQMAVCASNQRQLAVAAMTYTLDNLEWMNPLQDVRTGPEGGQDETTYRVILWEYVGRVPAVFDCPAEKVAVYADGVSAPDAELGGFALAPGTDWSRLYGYPSPYEVWNASGIGVAGAHWIPVRNDPNPEGRVSTMPFGRPKDIVPGLEDQAGFNRLLQDDYGCRRHGGKANYAFADAHVGLYDANTIRCDEGECWWSLQLDAHAGVITLSLR